MDNINVQNYIICAILCYRYPSLSIVKYIIIKNLVNNLILISNYSYEKPYNYNPNQENGSANSTEKAKASFK